MLKQFTIYTPTHTYQWDTHPKVNILGGGNMSGKTWMLDTIHKNITDIIWCEDTDSNFECVMPYLTPYVVYIKPQPTFKHLTELMFNFKVADWMTPLDMLLINRMITHLNKNTTVSPELLKSIRRFIPEFNPSDMSLTHVPDMSSGEKQLLYLLLCVEDTIGDSPLILLDSPETYLHIDWQEQLIRELTNLNPNAQFIISTHAPSLISGYYDQVKEINQLIIDDRTDEDTSD